MTLLDIIDRVYDELYLAERAGDEALAEVLRRKIGEMEAERLACEDDPSEV